VVLTFEQITIDAHDPVALGHWWAEALGWMIVGQEEESVELRQSEHQLPGILFLICDDEKTGKNRLHFDFRPSDHEGEVNRLLALGAKRVDIGQGSPTWAVLCDPEGNEFCVLRQLNAARE